ncbi:hypothetical protein LA345_37270 (plasmid) [Burkholderia vietnamiensis]|uniref:Uncharacterized protein n=1 Tax=Burkholderia vietnamiensis (strain G4 / LMG 22486) TaxID=269482 RepID=A4JVH6_BURVG|nr:hypothetical protein Bcep1808_7402 [Burkholderia vietnamiensis G4]MCB4349467.1 hypothetical protein [Burkholderia vietnamiensis]
MSIAIKPSFARRWVAASIGLWMKIAPMVVVVSVALKLLGVGMWAAMTWASVVLYPSLAALSTLAIFGGWLALMTHDWNCREIGTTQ